MPENIASSIANRPNYTNNTQMEIQKQGSNAGIPVCNKVQNADSERKRWREIGHHSLARMLIIAGLFYYLFHNEVERIVSRWVEPNWSHGLLIPFFSLYFINQHKKEILNLQTRPNYLGLFFIMFGIAFYALNGASPSGYAYLQPISMIAILGAVVLFLGGWSLVKYTWLPIAFLVFAVPLPRRYYVAITMPMRHLAADISAVLLNLLGDLEASTSGVIIDVIYKGRHLEPLNVAEACSGMRLLMAFLALGVAMAYLHYRPVWQRIVLLASTIPIAILCNIVRVTVTGFIYVLIHPKYTQGIYHDMLGLAMLPLAFALYGFIAWFMSSLFVEENEIVTEDIVIRSKQ
ncbi:MAG: exosortase/archaeosortase family protein [Phycisphaerae bacterium]|nr:exosortase/archaeosortase family protein [Phycisphaerae bacterium]